VAAAAPQELERAKSPQSEAQTPTSGKPSIAAPAKASSPKSGAKLWKSGLRTKPALCKESRRREARALVYAKFQSQGGTACAAHLRKGLQYLESPVEGLDAVHRHMRTHPMEVSVILRPQGDLSKAAGLRMEIPFFAIFADLYALA
jgi:hypothetical protein